LKHKQDPKVMLMVVSAGIDPWLEIEQRGQMRIILDNSNKIQEHVWISGNPNFKHNWLHILLLGIGKLRMWHFPGKGRIFSLVRTLSLWLLKGFPTRLFMQFLFPSVYTPRNHSSNGNRVVMNLPISLFLSGYRTLGNFEWALANSQFDYLVRITSNCLINDTQLYGFIRSLPKTRVFAGRLSPSGDFVSGAAMLLSRDVVEELVENRKKLALDKYEDVAIGHLVKENNIADFSTMKILDLGSVAAARKCDLAELRSSPVVRCKAEYITVSSQPVLSVFYEVCRRLPLKGQEIYL
jgi:hypothetical protein